MLKTTLSVLLLNAAQNVAGLTLQDKVQETVDAPESKIMTDRAPKLTRDQLNALAGADIDAGIYDIGNGQPQCTLKKVKKALKQFYQREHVCNYKFDQDGLRPNEKKLGRCLGKNEDRKESRLDGCLADDDNNNDGGDNNGGGDNNNGGGDNNNGGGDNNNGGGDNNNGGGDNNNGGGDNNNGGGDNNNNGGCSGIPLTIPDYCTQNFSCDVIKEVYDYSLVRLDLHNQYRDDHRDTDPLTLDLDIACQARSWSDNMAENDLWEHSSSSQRPNQGENLAMQWGSGSWDAWQQRVYTPEIGWYDNEEPNYNYATGQSNGGVIGHFTQMVWKNSKTLGCGESRIRRGNMNYTYSTCRYSPPGNWMGQNLNQVGNRL